MQYFKLIILVFICLHLNVKAQNDYKIPENTKRIVFLGNSITYSGQYITYIEAYLKNRYPENQIKFINVGLPSETVSGLSEPNHAGGRFPRPDLHERLDRVLSQLKPDLVIACYGMNDGIYLPFDDTRFQKYKDGINWLNDQVLKSNASIIHVTPPLFDERKGKAYANVLDLYSDWLISQRYIANWDVIDIHWPMKKHLEDKRSIDSTFVLAKDGIHPNEIGHWLIAKQILLYLGENDVLKHENIKSALSSFTNGDQILELINERQHITKNSWLTSTGHTRPGLKTGLPLEEAQIKADEIENQIKNYKVE